MSSLILNPIDPSFPCGNDCKYEDAFLAIEAEVDRSTSVYEGVQTDWPFVLSESASLLEKNTKDIKIASWWVYASYKTGGDSVLSETLSVFNDFLMAFGSGLFPKSDRVKVSAFTWLEALFNAEFLGTRGEVTSYLGASAELFLGRFEALNKAFSLLLKEEESFFNQLRLSLNKAVQKQELENSGSKPVIQPSVKPVKSNAVVSESVVSEIGSDAEAMSVMRSLKKYAMLLQSYYRENEASDVRALRLVRLLSWLEVEGLPTQAGNKTLLNPPSKESLDRLDELVQEKLHCEAFSFVENVITLSPFWFEGHYISFTLLKEMGCDKAALEVQQGVIAFIKSNVKVLDLNFSDTTPFVPVRIKEWAVESVDSSVVLPNDNADDNAKKRIIEEAYALAKKQMIKEGMGLLQRCSAEATSKEESFFWRLTQVELALEFNRNDVAITLLRELKKEVDDYRLSEWKPALAARVFKLFLGFDRTQVDIEEINLTYARLCKIDIESALDIKI